MAPSRNKPAPRPSSEGDLFPRGKAATATPRVKRRTGEVLFEPPSKRTRPTRNPSADHADPPLPVTRHGLSLSHSHLTPGATLLAVVTRADLRAVHFALPSGLRASAPPDEILITSEATHSAAKPVLPLRGQHAASDSDSDSDAMSTDGSDGGESEEGAPVPLCEAVSTGETVRVAVVSNEHNAHGKRAVTVSMKPELVNAGLSEKRVTRRGSPLYAVVRSVEDHGYVLTFGSGVPHTAFLPFDESEGELRMGSPVEVVVEADVSRKKKRKNGPVLPVVVNVSALKEKVIKARVEDTAGLTYSELTAGMLVPARVVKEGPGGVALTAFSVFKLSVDASHVPRRADGTWDVDVGKLVTARIFYVDPSQKRIASSLLPSLVDELRPREVPQSWKIGSFMKRLKVERVKPGFGLIMSYVGAEGAEETLEDEDTAKFAGDNIGIHVPVFAHISRVSDSKDVKLESRYHPGMIVEDGARVISVSRFDGLVNIDLRRSILARKALSIEEIEVGALYDCKVISHTTMGAVTVAVDGDSHLFGIIQAAHLSDVPMTPKRMAMQENLRIGATIRCRAIRVDVGRGKTYLSAKKSLISPKYPLLTSFEQAEKSLVISKRRSSEDDLVEPDRPKALFTGSVIKVLDSGSVLVAFCEDMAGLAPVRELCIDTNKTEAEQLADIKELYPVGQTVHVKLTKIDTPRRRITISMDLRGASGSSAAKALSLGQVVGGHITSADEQAKHFIVSVQVPSNSVTTAAKGGPQDQATEQGKSGSSIGSVECYLPFGHIADVPGIAPQLVKEVLGLLGKAQKGERGSPITLSDLMVLSVSEDRPVLTLKPSLKAASAQGLLPKSFNDVKRIVERTTTDQQKPVLRGYVKALLGTGAIIAFLGDSVGFTRISRIADHFVSDPARALQIHNSVAAVVDNIDEKKQRFSLSLRLSDVGFSGLEADTLSLFSSLEEWQDLLGKTGVLKGFAIGSIEQARVHAEHSYGVMYKLQTAGESAVGVCLDVTQPDSEAMRDEALPLATCIGTESTFSEKTKRSEASKEDNVRILDVDPFSGVIDLSRQEEVVAGGRKKSILNTGSSFSATVLLVKSAYLILAVARSKTRSAIAFALSPPVSVKLAITPGTSVRCTVLDKVKAETRRNLVVIDWKSFRASQQRHSQKVTQHNDDRTGDTLTLLRQSLVEEQKVLGRHVKGKITRTFPLHSFVAIARGVVGHLHRTNLSFVTPEETLGIPLGVLPANLSTRFVLPKEGSRVEHAFISGIRRRMCEGEENTPVVVELSLSEERARHHAIAKGSKVVGFVTHLSSRMRKSNSGKSEDRTQSYTRVAVNASASICCMDVNCLFQGDPIDLKVGSAVVCMVTEVEEKENGRIWGALSENGKDPGFFHGIVQAVMQGVGLRVEIPWFARDATAKTIARGTVGLCDMAANFDEVAQKMKTVQKGDVVRVRKVGLDSNSDSADGAICLSMRPSDTDSGGDPLVTKATMPLIKEGAKMRGFVRAVSKKGCFVAVGRNVSAQVLLCDLADGYVKDPEESFPVGMLVEGVAGKPKSNNEEIRIPLILRKRPRKKLKENPAVKDLQEGTKVTGTVKHIGNYGAVLELSKGVTALLHKSEVDQDRFIQNPNEEWCVGQTVNAIVIKVDEKGVKVGTKACYFEAAGLDEDDMNTLIESNKNSRQAALRSAEDVDMVPRILDGEDSNADGDEPVNDSESELEGSPGSDGDSGADGCTVESGDIELATVQGRRKAQIAPLRVGQGFNFAEDDELGTKREEKDEEPESEGENEGHGEQTKRKSRDKREKKRQKEATETAIRMREEALANNPDSPETAEDFERLLVGEPNSSVLWIRYMAFCLSLSQVDKARSIAERALETISLQQETDRMNVWIAYMNLEAQFGASNSTSDTVTDAFGLKRGAAVFRVFDRGCARVTDVKGFHMQAAAALRSSSADLADEVLRRASRRFRGSKKVWIALGNARFSSGNISGARRCLEKALKSLEKRKHVAVICKFAQFEYKFGSSERGRTVFESLVGNFPKRLDLWSIYLDMQTSYCRRDLEGGNTEYVEATRKLFERCTTLDLSSKKMKFVFKKWLNFEKEFGDQEKRALVKDQARDYVQRSVNPSS